MAVSSLFNVGKLLLMKITVMLEFECTFTIYFARYLSKRFVDVSLKNRKNKED